MNAIYADQLEKHPAKPDIVMYLGACDSTAIRWQNTTRRIGTRFIQNVGEITIQELELMNRGLILIDTTQKAGMQINKATIENMLGVYAAMNKSVGEVMVLGIANSLRQYRDFAEQIVEYNRATADFSKQKIMAIHREMDPFTILGALMKVRSEPQDCIDQDKHSP